MANVLSEHFECFNCHKIFYGCVYEIVRERCRLHFEEALSYTDSTDLRGLECYCSRACLEACVDGVMARERMPVTHPGLDRVVLCSVCKSPVDRTGFHYAYLATLSEPLDDVVWDTLQAEYLAVICEACGEAAARAHT